MEKNKLTQNELQYELINACQLGNFELVKNMYDKYYSENNSFKNKFLSLSKLSNRSSPTLDMPYITPFVLVEACAANNSEITNFLLTKKELIKNMDDNQQILAICLKEFIIHNNLEMVEIFTPLIKTKNKSFYDTICPGFMYACEQGNIEMVKYVSEHFDIGKDKVNYSTGYPVKYQGFMEACRTGKLNVVEYLINTPDFDLKQIDTIINVNRNIAVELSNNHNLKTEDKLKLNLNQNEHIFEPTKPKF
jgi:hypothetical protein